MSAPRSSPGKNPATTAFAGNPLLEVVCWGEEVEGLCVASTAVPEVDEVVAGMGEAVGPGVVRVSFDEVDAVGFGDDDLEDDDDDPGLSIEHWPSTQLYPLGQQSWPHLGSSPDRSVFCTGLRGCSDAFCSEMSHVIGWMN